MGQIDFKKTIEGLKSTGYNPIPSAVKVSIPDARSILTRGLRYYNNDAFWLPEYDEVVDWLSDNKGKGLLCYGNCGRGKSLICWNIIPLLLNHYHNLIVSCYSAIQMNQNINKVIDQHVLCLDDIGTEGMSSVWGEKRMVFSEIVDQAEKKGKLLIITTNLSYEEIAAKYGERTMDRLIAITRRVKFVGESLRR